MDNIEIHIKPENILSTSAKFYKRGLNSTPSKVQVNAHSLQHLSAPEISTFLRNEKIAILETERSGISTAPRANI